MNASQDHRQTAASLEIDVSEAAGLDRQVHTKATVTFPDITGTPDYFVVAFTVPGAGLNRSYFSFLRHYDEAPTLLKSQPE